MPTHQIKLPLIFPAICYVWQSMITPSSKLSECDVEYTLPTMRLLVTCQYIVYTEIIKRHKIHDKLAEHKILILEKQ